MRSIPSLLRTLPALSLPALLAACGGGGSFEEALGEALTPTRVVVATPDNTFDSTMYVDSGWSNGNPDAVVFATRVSNPGGGPAGPRNVVPVGVRYNAARERWGVFQENGTDMPLDVAYFVLTLPDGGAGEVHVTTAASTEENYSWIDHPTANGNQDALLFVTHSLTTPAGTSAMHPHVIGVWYSTVTRRWAVYNEDAIDMGDGRAFNVMVLERDGNTFVHTSSAANRSGPLTYIDHPRLNGRPGAQFQITHNFNPEAATGNRYDRIVGAFYDDASGRWAIRNEDVAVLMPVGISFNVFVIG